MFRAPPRWFEGLGPWVEALILAVLVTVAFLLLSGCTAAWWTCKPGGGVLTGTGGCSVILVRALTDADLLVIGVGPNRTLSMGSRINVEAVGAASAAAALAFGGHPLIPKAKPGPRGPPIPKPKPRRDDDGRQDRAGRRAGP
jgi:hypothetical protein